MNSEIPFVPATSLPSGPGIFGQHEMHDVLGEVVLTVADPHLVAEQAKSRPKLVAFGTDSVGNRASQDIGQARTGLRFGQAHRAEPLTVDLIPRKDVLLRRRPALHDQVDVSNREHAAAAQSDTGLGKECIGSEFHDVGKL